MADSPTTPAPIIAASILSADFARLGQEVDKVLAAGADWIHFDVMDNHYVPNLTVGPMVCAALRQYGVKAPIDVHLMVEPVDALIPAFADAGATTISFHPQASKHPHRTIQRIKSYGCAAGVSLNPGTDISELTYLIDELSLVLLMSVNPGFGGQQFISRTIDKVRAVRQMIDFGENAIRLQVDGGICADNIQEIAAAGADTFVVGSAIFKHQDYSDALRVLREKLV